MEKENIEIIPNECAVQIAVRQRPVMPYDIDPHTDGIISDGGGDHNNVRTGLNNIFPLHINIIVYNLFICFYRLLLLKIDHLFLINFSVQKYVKLNSISNWWNP